MRTECSKCNAPMPAPAPSAAGWLNHGVTTGYQCKECGHWNNLKRRNGYVEWKLKQLKGAAHANP